MKRFSLLFLLQLLFLLNACEIYATGNTTSANQTSPVIPSVIISNSGQADPDVRFLCKSVLSTVYFKDQGIIYQYFSVKSNTDQYSLDRNFETTVENVGLSFVGRKAPLNYEPFLPGTGRINYFIGNDPSTWNKDIQLYNGLKVKEVFPSIDLLYNTNGSAFKTDFILKPGSQIRDLVLKYSGIDHCSLGENGELLIYTSKGLLTERIPLAYQRIGNKMVKVNVRYLLINKHTVTFTVNSYNPDYDLIIDPAIIYSTYIGGSGDDALYYGNMVRDNLGNIYFTGRTSSTNFPTTIGAYDINYNTGNYDAFVIKLNPSGTALVFATYIGSSNSDYGYDLALDQNNNIVVTGCTNGTTFPITTGAFQSSYTGAGLDAFVLKLSSSGNNLIFSTYIGGPGDDQGEAMVLDGNDNIYLTGQAQGGFPVTPGAYQTIHGGTGGDYDFFIIKMNNLGTSLVYSTFIGGSGQDRGSKIVIDNLGNAYVIGQTDGSFPVTPGAFDEIHNGGNDVAAIKMNSTGTSLIYSTYIGGPGNDWPTCGLALNAVGEITISGYCAGGFPVTPGAYDQTFNGGTSDGFITRLNDIGSALLFSTYLGSNGPDQAWGLYVTPANKIYVTGKATTGFPTTICAYDQTFNGGTNDVFVLRLNETASTLEYSSFFGGSGNEVGRFISADADTLYVVGETSSSNLPVSSGCFDPSFNTGTNDLFVLKLSLDVTVIADFSMNDTVCTGTTVNFTNLSTTSATYQWQFGDNTSSILFSPSHTYNFPGVYYVSLTATNSCNTATVVHSVYVFGVPANIGDTVMVSNQSIIARYPFNNNVLDYSNNNLHATLYGAMIGADNCQVPLSSYILNGNGNYIQAPHSVMYNTYPISISFWFKKNNNNIQLTPGMGFSEFLLVKNDDLGPDSHFAMWLRNQNPPWELAYGAGNGTTLPTIAFPDSIFPNTWYHIGGVIRSNKLLLYFNGMLVDSINVTGTIMTNSFPILIGKSPDYTSTRWLNGNVEELRFYGRELSACEFKILYEKCNPRLLGVSQLDTLVCIASSVCINVINPEPGIVYQLLTYPALTPVGQPLSVCADTICLSTGSLNTSTNFVIIASLPGDLCSQYLDTIFHVTVIQEISLQEFATICEEDSIFLGGAWQNTPGIYHDTIPIISGCDTIIHTTLNVNPVYSISNNHNMCQGDSVIFNGNYIHNAGIYTASLQTILGCDSILQLTVVISPFYFIPSYDSICEGDSILFDGTYFHTSGIYNDTLQTGSGCDSINQLHLVVNPLPQILLPSDTGMCQGEHLVIDASTLNYIYLWSTGSTTDTIVVWQEGNYGLTVTNAFGCQAKDSLYVTLYPIPLLTVQPSGATICKDSSIVLQVTGAQTYQWTPASSLSSPIDSVVTAFPLENTIYYVSGMTSAGCIGDTTIKVTVVLPPVGLLPDSLYLCVGEIIELNPGYCSNCTYFWSDNTTNPRLTANKPGNYWVKITEDGCSALDSISLKECMEIWIPNVFTPNGDGLNETFNVKGINIDSFHMYIFNRWGMKLYETDDLMLGWDGMYKGDLCSDGVYVYLIEYKGYRTGMQLEERKVSGAVTLLR